MEKDAVVDGRVESGSCIDRQVDDFFSKLLIAFPLRR
jgi:hypothetical protein